MLMLGVKNRKSLNNPADAADELHAMRRGGARREVSARVSLRSGEKVLEGWALNISRGGVRVILEDSVELGREFEVSLDGAVPAKHQGRIVWVQEEPDGVVAGIAFVGSSQSPPGPDGD